MKTYKKVFFTIITLLLASSAFSQVKITCLNSLQIGTNYSTSIYWDLISSNCGGAVSYEVYETSSANQLGNIIHTGNATNYTHSSIVPPTLFYVKATTICNPINQYSEIVDSKVGARPEAVVIDSISVDANNKTIMGFQESANNSVISYEVIQLQGANNVKIDTIVASTSYLNTKSQPDIASESYVLLGVGGCGVNSALGNPPNYFKTIFLSVDYNKCKLEASLSWTSYSNFKLGLNEYEIFVIKDGIETKLTSTTSTKYTHKGLAFASTYLYYVRAKENSSFNSSSSNRVSLSTQPAVYPAKLRINKVDIITVPIVYGEVEVSPKITYKLFRGVGNGALKLLTNLSVTDTLVQYSDFSADATANSYQYQIIAYDSCSIPIDSSEIHKTVLINIKSDNFFNELTWNSYEGWNQIGGMAAEEVRIYRQKDGIWELSPFYSSTNTSITSLQDSVGLYYESDNEFCYYLEFYESPISGSSVSRSNVICAKQKSNTFIPSGFFPDNMTEFKPIGSFISSKDYKFEIYNKWGVLIFETIDKSVGWKAIDAPMGTYVYVLEYTNPPTKKVVKRGLVSILR